MTEASPPIADELPGPAELAGYPAIRELGAGSGGHVYEVSAAGGGKLAVKVLEGAAPTDGQGEEQLAQRVHAFALIDHPHLVRTYDLAPAGRNLCLVMEYVAGPDLRQVLAARRPSPEEVATWVTQLAEAVDYLHRLGIVHRDLKPSNVLIAADGSLKLGDVAVSDLLAGAPSVQGTPAYMAPELVRGDLLVDGRADVYSLATIAYEALCGLPPFPGLGAEAAMAAQLRRPPPDPSRIIPGFPEAVSEVLLRGLAKAPGERPATAAEFAEALSPALRGQQ
ncbi:MAG: serine/threonine-protein kinase, partial [Candidatus Dormibacteraceae bacterium]